MDSGDSDDGVLIVVTVVTVVMVSDSGGAVAVAVVIVVPTCYLDKKWTPNNSFSSFFQRYLQCKKS
jgi:hypothetical protein